MKRAKSGWDHDCGAPVGLSAETAEQQWARQLATDVKAVVDRHPEADPDDVRRTLICLQMPPLDRLNRSLRRGRGFAAFRG